eukprot:11227733-Alexandrium_andersonii.AAC.1
MALACRDRARGLCPAAPSCGRGCRGPPRRWCCLPGQAGSAVTSRSRAKSAPCGRRVRPSPALPLTGMA